MPSRLLWNVSNFAAGNKAHPVPPQGRVPPPSPPQGGVVTLICARLGSLQVRSKSVSSPFQVRSLYRRYKVATPSHPRSDEVSGKKKRAYPNGD